MNSIANPIARMWKSWFMPRSTDPTIHYRERALRILLPAIIVLRIVGILRYSNLPGTPAPYAPIWLRLVFFVIPTLLSVYFLARQKVDWAGVFFLLHWYLTDLLSLSIEGYWYPGFQTSLIIQIVLGTLLLPSRVILPFWAFQIVTVGIWGGWLDVNYYDPPLLSSGEPVAIFLVTIITLAMQQAIIMVIIRYLRLYMERSVRQLQGEVAERQHAEGRLRSIVENSPSLILELDRNGIVKFANAQTERLLGADIYQFILPETRERITNAFASVFETGKNVETEERVISTSGSIHWNAIRLGPIYSGDKVTGIIATLDNITERKEAELQARQRAEQLATIVSIGHAVSTLQDLDSVLEAIYRQSQRIALVDTFYICLYDEKTNQISFPLLYDTDVRYEESTIPLQPDTWIAQVIRTGKPFILHRTEEELREPVSRTLGNNKRKSASILVVPLWLGEKVLGVLSVQSYTLNAYTEETVEILTGIGNAAAIAIQNSRLFTSAQQELVERKLAEGTREKLIQELEQRNAELERLAYTLSHELKSPLITIRGFLGYLWEDAANGDTTRLERDFRRITNGTDKMLRLINELIDLMSVGRIVHDFQEFSLHELAEEAIELIQDKIAGKNIAVHLAGDLPQVYGDYKRLVEVFQNLLENSIKFMGEQPEPKIEIGWRQEADATPTFYVRDNGIGIEPRFNERIFGIFHKLDAMSEGTGIGLALVKRIIEYHGGRVWVESDGSGTGSTFCFTIHDSGR